MGLLCDYYVITMRCTTRSSNQPRRRPPRNWGVVSTLGTRSVPQRATPFPAHDQASAQQRSNLSATLAHASQELWDRVVCTVAKTVVLSKFASDGELRRVLLSTGNHLIAEAAKNDHNWGIGLDMPQPEVAVPSQWRGANMLGWALMEARTTLRAAAAPAPS